MVYYGNYSLNLKSKWEENIMIAFVVAFLLSSFVSSL